MEATIEVAGLRKRFGAVLALDGMSFTVRPGQVTGFVGPNGAGKSTTMRVVLGLDSADEGSALVGGMPYRRLRRPLSHVGSLLDAAALQPSRSARNHLLWLAHSQGLTARRVDEVAEQAGLAGVIRRKAGGYSLGMRQRLGIAAALLGDPPVLMMDEPFNGMDPEGIVWMRGFLRSLAAQGRAVLVSSHLMSELQDTAGHLVVAGRGHVIADTSVADLIAAASGDRVAVRTSARAQAMTVLSRAGATVAATGPGALTVSGLCKSFGGLHVTTDVDLDVEPGERRLIIGPNGAGKTTLFNLITGEISPDKGSIHLFGQDVTKVPSRRRPHLGMARTYQIITLFPRDSIVHNVSLALLGLSPLRWNPIIDMKRQGHIVEHARTALERVGLAHIAERPLAQTSYGERRRVEIAMALAQNPKLLLLDEPFAGLSIDERRDVQQCLMAIPRDVTMVMIEHNMDVALEFAERITLLHFGEVIVEGNRAEVVADPRTREVYLGH